MKKVKFEKKLVLNKETIAKLNQDQMNNVKGGEEAFSSSVNGGICFCLTTLLHCNVTEQSCNTKCQVCDPSVTIIG